MPSIVSLVDPAIRTWVTGETYTPRKVNADDEPLRQGIEDLNSAIADVEKNYASSSQPSYKPQGKEWYDSGNSILKLYHTTNGTPVGLLDTSNAYNQSLTAGTGTATFKLGGNIDVNTTPVSILDGSTGNLIQKSVPGNTLNSNNQILRAVAFGTHAGATSAIGFGFGTATVTPPFAGAAVSDWFGKAFIVRAGASTFKIFGVGIDNVDSVGDTADVNSSSGTDDLSAAQTLTVSKSIVGGDVAQQIMVTGLIP